MWYRHSTPLLLQKIYPSLVWHQPRNEKKIYLTFDDGPIPELTPWVLSVLDRFEIKATFFCVGENAKKYPQILNKIVSEGHHVGNHTFNHLDGWKTENVRYFENVEKCNAELTTATHYAHKKLFRPPYGKIKSGQIKTLKSDYSIVMWDVLSGDFDQSLSPEDCLKNSIKATQNGSVVIFHDNIKAMKNIKHALPRYIEYFLGKGYAFDTL